MSATHEAISAFLDDEPFDPEELATALSDPAGRALLIDLVALRRIVQPVAAVLPVATSHTRRLTWRLAAAAAVLLALVGGYVAGERHVLTPPDGAPAPTRVVEAVAFVPTGGRP